MRTPPGARFTCDFFKDSMEPIKVLGSIGLEEDVERRAGASDGSWPLIPTELLNDSAVQVVPITYLHEVVLAHVVELQAQHGEPRGRETGRQAQRSPLCTLTGIYLVTLVPPLHPQAGNQQVPNHTKSSSFHLLFCSMMPRSQLSSTQLLQESM